MYLWIDYLGFSFIDSLIHVFKKYLNSQIHMYAWLFENCIEELNKTSD